MVVNAIPGGAIWSKVKAVFNGLITYLGFGNYKPTYLKAMVYTKNDHYYSRTKIVYYKYSDSARKKQIGSAETRIHEVQIKKFR